MSQTKYMGPTAIKALQILNTQVQMHNTSSVSHPQNITNVTLTSTQSSPRSIDIASQPNVPNTHATPNLSPAVQLQNVQKTKHS